MRLVAKNNTVIVRPSYEPQKRLSRFRYDAQEIETKEFGKVKVDSNQSYKNVGPGNHIAWGVVDSIGAGPAWMGKHRFDEGLRPGDTIGFESNRVSTLCFEGEDVFFVPADAVLCRFNPGLLEPEPLGVNILTREEPGSGERITFSEAGRGRYVLPRTSADGAIKVSDSPHSQVKFAVERVVAVGPGGMGHSEIRTERSVHEEVRERVLLPNGTIAGSRVVTTRVIEKRQEPVWIQPDPSAIGRLAMFLHTMSTDVYVQEVRYRLTNWDRVRGLVEEDAEWGLARAAS